MQLLLWLLSGCYMVWMDIQFIRGQQLIKQHSAPIAELDKFKIEPAMLQQSYGPLTRLTLLAHPSGPAYLIEANQQRRLLSAISGEELPSLLTQGQAIALGRAHYALSGEVKNARLLESTPDEISWAQPPLWQVNFTGLGNPRLYLDGQTGQLISKRHDYWQWFDFLWMLHIMDYDSREDIHNPLLSMAATLALLSALAGVLLLWLGRRGKAV
ncbi:hypothetical protein [Shewanella sp. GXUN23E]|uniref:hypothetical protein n=1 Tax=Shewanella sp. GXUN23E TaxID=3422498 RepID=UPI003D7C631E